MLSLARHVAAGQHDGERAVVELQLLQQVLLDVKGELIVAEEHIPEEGLLGGLLRLATLTLRGPLHRHPFPVEGEDEREGVGTVVREEVE